jgi:hypothetical protein
MNMRTNPTARRRRNGERRRPGHSRLHRPRVHLRVPPGPQGADRRDPHPLPREPGRHLRLVLVLAISAGCSPPSGSCSVRLAGGTSGRWIAASVWRLPSSQVIGLSPMGAPSSHASATTRWCRRARPMRSEPSSSSTPGSVGPSARPVGYALTASFTVPSGHRRHPRHCPALDGVPRLQCRRASSPPASSSPGARSAEHHQLRRLRGVVPVAHRHGRRSSGARTPCTR